MKSSLTGVAMSPRPSTACVPTDIFSTFKAYVIGRRHAKRPASVASVPACLNVGVERSMPKGGKSRR